MKTLILLLLAAFTQAQTPMKGKGVHIDSATGKFYTVAVPDTGIAVRSMPPQAMKTQNKKKKTIK